MLIEILEPNFRNESDKGTLLQLVREGWKQVNVVVYRKGVISGGHYHKYNEECFYIISGAIELTVWKYDDEKEKYEFHTGDMFKISKYVFHTFVYKENSMLVALYDNGVELDGDTKDIWSEQAIRGSKDKLTNRD